MDFAKQHSLARALYSSRSSSVVLSQNRRGQRGFSLLEILVVLVIMGIMIGLIAPNIIGEVDKARVTQAKSDFKTIETALKMYKLDNFVYPSTEQGLEALVSKSDIDPSPRNFKEGGYLPKVPKDPWGGNYIYIYPGEHGEFDIYTLGADGVSGGEGPGEDIGNWDKDEG